MVRKGNEKRKEKKIEKRKKIKMDKKTLLIFALFVSLIPAKGQGADSVYQTLPVLDLELPAELPSADSGNIATSDSTSLATSASANAVNPASADSLIQTLSDSTALATSTDEAAQEAADSAAIVAASLVEAQRIEAQRAAAAAAYAADSIKSVEAGRQSMMQSWVQNFSVKAVSDSLLQLAMADTSYSDLYRKVGTMAFDSSLVYAQADLRMPVVIDGDIPDLHSAPLVADQPVMPQDAYEQLAAKAETDNPYSRQLAFGSMRHAAVHRYASCHLNEVAWYRKDDFDVFRQNRIERRELYKQERVDAEGGIQLDDSDLNIEQVVFHADKWHRKGVTDLQLSQTSLSDNWYKGGENNMTLSTYDKLVFSRYDESMKTSLDISLELRLSGYYTQSDTIHPIRVNDNTFRADVSYGYKAWKNWYYSTSAYLKTPLFEYYNANSKVVKSTFLSPLEFNLSVGMDLKLNKKKTCSYSLFLAPVSYNLKYVHDHRVSVTSYGIEAGNRSRNQFGASVTSRLEWTISPYLSWSSRAYYFTSYHSVLVEFENTFNIKLGRYCTSKLYLYPRFDDSVDDKVQMKETLTFGMSFVW